MSNTMGGWSNGSDPFAWLRDRLQYRQSAVDENQRHRNAMEATAMNHQAAAEAQIAVMNAQHANHKDLINHQAGVARDIADGAPIQGFSGQGMSVKVGPKPSAGGAKSSGGRQRRRPLII